MELLNKEQKYAIDVVVEKSKSIFLTGCGGTGKSFVLEKMVEELRKRGRKGVAVTAMTGVAAFNIGGSTLHSFAGIGLGEGDKDELTKRVMFNVNARERWKKVKVLIIDEVSMMASTLLDKLEHIARTVRDKSTPFGGIQLVLTGDLLQLPPIETTSDREPRVFEAAAWKSCISKYIVLRKVIRQSDLEFVKLLTYIRLGCVDDSVLHLIDKMQQSKEYDTDCKPVNLYPTRAEAEGRNRAELDSLKGDPVVYEAEDTIRIRSGGERLLESCSASVTLTVKTGAQVMLVKNLSQTLVNGTVGVLTSFVNIKVPGEDASYTVPVVRFTLADGKVITKHLFKQTWTTETPGQGIAVARTQIPLILAWAVTIHKSQGQTIQYLRIDLTKSFAPGQIYTALSRAVGLETLEVTGFRKDLIKVDPKSIEFCVKNDLF